MVLRTGVASSARLAARHFVPRMLAPLSSFLQGALFAGPRCGQWYGIKRSLPPLYKVWSGHPARSFFAAAAPARARCASAPQAADFGCLPSPTHPMPRRAPGRFVGSIPEWARGMCPLFGAAVIWRYLGSSRMTLSGRPLEALVLSRLPRGQARSALEVPL